MKNLLAIFLLIPSISFGLSKEELKEELKYWKSLLDDELITQKQYEDKTNELLQEEIKIKDDKIENTKTNSNYNNSKEDTLLNTYKIAILEPTESNECFANRKIDWGDLDNLRDELINIFLKNDNKSLVILNKDEYNQRSIVDWENRSSSEVLWDIDADILINIITKKDCFDIKYELLKYTVGFKPFDFQKKFYSHTVISSLSDENDKYSKNLASVMYEDLMRHIYEYDEFRQKFDEKKQESEDKNKVIIVSSTENKSNSTRKDPCIGNNVSAWRWSVSTGYKSCREFDNAVQNMSDTKLCMEAEDEFFDRIKEAYLEEARYRKITCVGGAAYDNNNSNTNSIVRENQLEDKLEKKMECTAKRTEWKTLCKTGDYRIVNGVYCSQIWIDSLYCR